MANKDLLYSRQIAEIGEKTMGQLSQLHILIIGQKSVGFECSKCLTLMGVGNIYLYDSEDSKITIGETEIKTTNKDVFGLNFGLNAILNTLIESRKYTISELTAKYLRTLNPYIQINSNNVNQSLNNYIQIINRNFDLIIITDFRILNLSDFYEKRKNQNFIIGLTLGYYGLVYTNFPNHIVYDINGEPKRNSFMTNVSLEGNILKGQLEKNNLFSEGELTNYGKVVKCKLDKIEIKTDNNEINLDNIHIEEIKPKYKPEFPSWNEIKNDISKWNILSIGKNKFPLEKVLNHINLVEKQKKKDLTYEECTLYYELYPLGSIIGGIIAHEAIKITGKYTPIEQPLFIDSSIFLPEKGIKEKSGISCHIENLISGEILSKLKSSRIFMIGAGALGCEHAKNLVMMNGATTKQGLITITDPDTISLSNLSRQFLFQNENIGELKSKVIETKLASYFPKTRIKSLKEAVCKETYKTCFKYDHWRTQDILLGALDNHEARLFIDKMAVKFEKPLFESGTQGTKCHTQTIIPNKTITYGEIEDPPQESIPMCTIKNFPNNFTHCIEWALDAFHEIFSQTISDIIEIKNDKMKWLKHIETQNTNMIYDRISKVNIFLKHINKPTEEMIKGIIETIYNEYFIQPINILLESFPIDLEENGERFWGGKRKRPSIIDLNSSEIFKEGIMKGLKEIFKIKTVNSEFIYSSENNITKSEKVVKLSLEDLEKNKQKEISSKTIKDLVQKIKDFNDDSLKTMEISILEFDKDGEDTLEILFSLAVQRANCYSILLGSKSETRRIAGRIIPALSTTTTIVSGFVMLELLKYLHEEKPNDYSINIGINQLIGFETPEAPLKYSGMFDKAYNSKVIVIPENQTQWKKLKVSLIGDGIISMSDLIEHLKCELNIESIEMVLIDKDLIYCNGNDDKIDLIKLWSKYSIEYNDCIILNLVIQAELPVLTLPVYLYH